MVETDTLLGVPNYASVRVAVATMGYKHRVPRAELLCLNLGLAILLDLLVRLESAFRLLRN
jgi:acetoacetate decarboxylase